MNLPQRIVLIFAFLVILAMALFPPWKRIYNYPAEYGDYMNPHMEQSAGYHLILRDQSSGNAYAILRIDTTRLGVQFVAVLVLTGLLSVILRSAQKEQRL
jgi:hypothetical protein